VRDSRSRLNAKSRDCPKPQANLFPNASGNQIQPEFPEVDPGAGQIGQSGKISSQLNHAVSSRPIWLLDAASRSVPLRSTTARIAGPIGRRR
jgi:hypothetical protein